MGCRILVGTEEGSVIPSAVFFCSTSGWAFGPVMDDGDDARAFARYLETVPTIAPVTKRTTSDPRAYDEMMLRQHYVAYLGRRTRCTVCDDRTWDGEAFTPALGSLCAACGKRATADGEQQADADADQHNSMGGFYDRLAKDNKQVP